MKQLRAFAALLEKVYYLARPYGLGRLGAVFLLVLAQGVFQVVGVSSVFPFLALASDPGRVRDSRLGRQWLEALPPLDDQALLIVSGVLAITLLLTAAAVNLTSEVVRVRYANRFGHWLRLRILRRIASQPYGYFLRRNSGILLKKVAADVTQYVQGVLLPLLDAAARLTTVTLFLAFLLVLDPAIALGAGAGLGGFYVLTFLFFNRRRRAVSSGLKAANRGAMREANQFLGGIKPIKVHRAEEFFIGRFARHSAAQARLMALVPIYANGPRYLVEAAAFGGLIAFVLALAARGRAFADLLPVLGVIALAGYRLVPALQLLYASVTTLSSAKHALEEVYDEFAAAEETAEPEAGRPKDAAAGDLGRAAPLRWRRALALENVTFAYPESSEPVLNGVSLTIPKNSSAAFVGESGSGKSTLVDLILGLHRPASGRILVDGRELTPDGMVSWRAGIGYVPQDIFLIDDTVAANIALGVPHGEIDSERLREVCAAAQILDWVERGLPRGFETAVGERGARLSGGQRQRIGLARALYHRPQLLVLDEATSALDRRTEAALMHAIDSLRGSMTILIVAHRPSAVERCESVYELESGSVRPVIGSGIPR